MGLLLNEDRKAERPLALRLTRPMTPEQHVARWSVVCAIALLVLIAAGAFS